MPKFSVAIPIFNEEQNIEALYGRLTSVLEDLCRQEKISTSQYEIIFVDDGSRDQSWELIKALNKSDGRVRAVSFSRNFGHHLAVTAGLDHAKGEAVFLMDGDLQDPPEEMPKLYNKFKEGFDIVYALRRKRQDPPLKKLTSAFFWRTLRKFSEVDIPEGQTMLRVMSRRLVDVLKNMREYSRFVHGMIAWAGFPVATVEVDHGAREKGSSKYNFSRQIRLAFHALTSFSTIPLRLATYIGLVCSGLSFLVGIYYICKKIVFGFPVEGWASIIVSIFFVGGLQLLMLGVIGEYIGRTYQEVQRRPLYVLKESLL